MLIPEKKHRKWADSGHVKRVFWIKCLIGPMTKHLICVSNILEGLAQWGLHIQGSGILGTTLGHWWSAWTRGAWQWRGRRASRDRQKTKETSPCATDARGWVSQAPVGWAVSARPPWFQWACTASAEENEVGFTDSREYPAIATAVSHSLPCPSFFPCLSVVVWPQHGVREDLVHGADHGQLLLRCQAQDRHLS